MVECPKNRFIETPDEGPGRSCFREGCRAFLGHTGRSMKVMAGLIRQGRPKKSWRTAVFFTFRDGRNDTREGHA